MHWLQPMQDVASAACHGSRKAIGRTFSLHRLPVLPDELAHGGQDAPLSLHQLLQGWIWEQLRQLPDGPRCTHQAASAEGPHL